MPTEQHLPHPRFLNRNDRNSTGGDPPGGDQMYERVAKLEALLPNLATKADIGEVRADLHKADSATKAWMIATVISLFLGFAGLFFAMNSARREPVSAPAPTIIQVPAYVQQTAPATAPAPASSTTQKR